MSSTPPIPAEPRFFFLMPVWGETYIEYLLTFGLPTLLSPNNLPWLPNRAVSQFTFITRAEDEKDIRASKLFARLEALIPVKFIFLDFYESGRILKFDQLGNALKLGASEALGRGYCLFFHPDGLYSDGMVKHLYGVARSGKKACVTHGPNASIEKIVPYLRERNLLRFDEVNPIAPRALAHALMDNLHPDMTIHCMGNRHYPLDPYMGFWLSPKLDGAIFRFVSLHPWLVDMRELSEIVEFKAIDHNFIRKHGFIWSDIHIEADSDKILVIGLKPENECNAVPNCGITHSPVARLGRSLHKHSNCNYSRFCFFHGLKVHTGDLDADWYQFEVANLRWVNGIVSPRWAPSSPWSPPVYVQDLFNTVGAWFHYAGMFFTIAVIERRPMNALMKARKNTPNALRTLMDRIVDVLIELSRPLARILGRRLDYSEAFAVAPEFCAVCGSDPRRCVSGDMRSHV